MILSKTLGSSVAGPKVATIFVLLNIISFMSQVSYNSIKNYDFALFSSIATAGKVLPSRYSKNAPPAVEI